MKVETITETEKKFGKRQNKIEKKQYGMEK